MSATLFNSTSLTSSSSILLQDRRKSGFQVGCTFHSTNYIFDDFERFPPTAATVSSALLLGICSLPDTAFKGAVDTALADKECYGLETPNARMTCFVNKALVNVGAELSKLVPGRVSTEVDARLAYDTHAIVGKVENLLQLYNGIGIPAERLLFKIPSTWQGIEAARLLESEGIQTHMTFVYRYRN